MPDFRLLWARTRARFVGLPLWGRGVLVLGTPFVLAALALVLMLAWYYPQLPPLDEVLDYEPRQSLQVFSRDGVQLGNFGAEHRQFMPIERMPRLLQDAVLAVEDSRFREHGGIDPRGLLRAAVANLWPGGMRQGASTITQQVARTFFLSTQRTAERKLKEAMLALKIESQLSKDQILELYMNQIYLGQRAYGFAAASQVYFGKPLDQLSVAETAMLAGLPQNPGYANPIANFDRAKARQLLVLQRMRVTGVIDDAQLAQARDEKLVIRTARTNGLHAEYVAEMARQIVHQRYGESAYTRGLRVTTSILADDQQVAYQALRRALLAHDRRQPYRGPEDHEELPARAEDDEQAVAQALKDHRDDDQLRVALVTRAGPREVIARLNGGEEVRLDADSLRWAQPALSSRAGQDLRIRRGSVIRVLAPSGSRAGAAWSLAQWPEVQGAFVSLDPDTGRIRALVGGFDFRRSQFNHVTQAWRQPGSAFKPFLYGAAMEQGVMPATLVNDAPLPAGDWDPKNSDDRFDGPITLRDALAQSKNLVSIRVLQHTGVDAARRFAERFGFEPARHPANLTLALGAGSTTPLQLAAGYAVLANGGHRVETVLVERITDAQGQVLFEAPQPPALGESTRVVAERTTFLVNSLLREVMRSGTGARAQQQLRRPDLYGKTGTTNDAVDAWFAGFQPERVAVVWIGYDDPRSLGARETGGGLALPVWIDYMARSLRGVPEREIEPPPGVIHGVIEGREDWLFADPPERGFVARIDVPFLPWETPGVPGAPGDPGAPVAPFGSPGNIGEQPLPPSGPPAAPQPPGPRPPARPAPRPPSNEPQFPQYNM